MNSITRYCLGFCFTLLFFSACKQNNWEAGASWTLPEKVDFNFHVKPILSDRCFNCHGPDEESREAGFRLDTEEGAFALLSNQQRGIIPGKAHQSGLFKRISSDDPDVVMPPPESKLSLSDREIALIGKWIEQGAEWKKHWSFIPPKKSSIPKVKNADWPSTPIDYFVLEQLETQQLQPSSATDRETLLRRLSFDLTGLPPSIEAIDQFLKDESSNALEHAVDRLLASPHYGERMAVDWLDVARYADTHGYTVDRYRDMSPWRDWVIKAFNENMPFDQFIQWQLAGDLLPDPSREQLLATGFNRNHPQNMEGGIVPEEFRVEYVADRTNTLGAAFLGLTMECARCHDHKYDPISQEEYFQLFSFFNNVNEAGQISWDNAAPVPTLLLTDNKVDSIADFIRNKISTEENKIKKKQNNQLQDFEEWLHTDRLNKSMPQGLPDGLRALFQLETKKLSNDLNPSIGGKLGQNAVSAYIPPELVEGKFGKGLLLNGDAWLDLSPVGVFDRAAPFSIGLWIHLPEDLENGVIFHKGDGAQLYNFRGFHVALKNNKTEIVLAHTMPNNAIVAYGPELPRTEWIHLMLSYDGSSKAKGLNFYVNGISQALDVQNDNLYKSLLFNFNTPEKGLQIGARWRGKGIGGAIVDNIMVYDRALSDLEVLQLFQPKELQKVLQKPTAELTTKEQKALKDYYFASSNKLNFANLKSLRQQLNSTLDTVQEVMVMEEMKNPRPAFVLIRGQYDVHGKQVYPATPVSVLPFSDTLASNRLGLAKWILNEKNPLTARVLVNRVWQQFFGRGLVKTAEDFGNQGELPSHPELLDWLAVEFMESGWDLKALIKQIVRSKTYQQSSKIQVELLEKDPENIWLARGPSQRLTAEMIRDNVLAASGLLVPKIGGKSVKPYQPAGLWAVNSGKYEQDKGSNLYRRSIYTFWKRSIPHPTQGNFDAPSRNNCTVRRQKTSTPLQALVLLNDPTFTEAARVLGLSISEANSPKVGIQEAFRKLTGRKASEDELNILLELQRSELSNFKAYPKKAKGWLNSGDYISDSSIAPDTLAANAVVASTIINMDACIIKR